MAELIVKTYGDALFELALEEGKEDTFLKEVTQLWRIWSENPEFGKLMKHAGISREEKVQALEEMLEGRISRELLGFLVLTVQKDRFGELGQIFRHFGERIKEERGVGTAYVTTAMELTGGQKKRIEKRLLETTSYKRLEIHYRVEESLIGGIVIRMGDRVVDGSVKNKLEAITGQLHEIQLQI